ncbi:MAG: NAD(P)-binding oxidoreductase [Bacteroidales bacterium]
MSSKPTLTVIGATGNLGAPVVKHLALMGYPVKAIVRNPEKAEKLFAGLSGVEIYRANLQRVGELRPALAGSTHVYLNLSTNTVDRTLPFYEEREGVANILEAIDPTAIRQILCISGLGAFDNVAPTGDFSFVPNLIRKQGHRLIKDSGIPYTFLHCTSFLDNFVLYRRKGAYSVIGSTQFPIHFTNCYDYSRHLARAIDNRTRCTANSPFRECSPTATKKPRRPSWRPSTRKPR